MPMDIEVVAGIGVRMIEPLDLRPRSKLEKELTQFLEKKLRRVKMLVLGVAVCLEMVDKMVDYLDLEYNWFVNIPVGAGNHRRRVFEYRNHLIGLGHIGVVHHFVVGTGIWDDNWDLRERVEVAISRQEIASRIGDVEAIEVYWKLEGWNRHRWSGKWINLWKDTSPGFRLRRLLDAPQVSGWGQCY